MKIIGFLLVVLGIIGIVLTVMNTAAFGFGGLIAGATAILTGIVFIAACYTRQDCCNRNHNCCN